MDKRGEIENRERARQIIDFSKLTYNGNITPTDLDGMIDFGNKAFVFIEYKVTGNKLPNGQKLALERLADNMALAGKYSVLIKGEHNTGIEFDIDGGGNWAVARKLGNEEWEDLYHTTIKEAIDNFLKEVELEYYILKD